MPLREATPGTTPGTFLPPFQVFLLSRSQARLNKVGGRCACFVFLIETASYLRSALQTKLFSRNAVLEICVSIHVDLEWCGRENVP